MALMAAARAAILLASVSMLSSLSLTAAGVAAVAFIPSSFPRSHPLHDAITTRHALHTLAALKQQPSNASVVDSSHGYTEEAIADRITSLPGLIDTLSFTHYSGFLSADTTGHKHLHYWFVESQRSPSTDPLVWWTNGGPGCSGLIGFFEEHGPFRVHPDSQSLLLNPYSWNRIANVLYIEAPVGVGFSFSSDLHDYLNSSDSNTATENYLAFESFFLKFPQFQGHELVLSGESYG